MKLALTGGIACGKSLFATFLRDEGFETLDADDVTHRLEAPGGEAVAPLVASFGREILAADGSVDRRALGARVFSDEAARARLNAILHPLVRRELSIWRDAPGSRPKMAVIPLLFECGWESDWDEIVCLACCEQTQIDRMMQMRGLGEKEARARLAAQMPVSEKVARSSFVVYNDSDVAALRAEASRLAARLRALA